MSNASAKIKRFEVLDVFRGLAAILVAVNHYSHENGQVGELALIAHGYRFVDFFFVLSGFIMYLNYRGISTWAAQKLFLVKRVWRLYPLHLFMLMFFLVFELFKAVLYQHGFFNKAPFTTNSPSAFLKNLFLLQGVVPSFEYFSWNYPSWSISVEMINYLIFSLVILLLHKLHIVRDYIVLLLISATSLMVIMLGAGCFQFVLQCSYGFFLGCLVFLFYENYYKSVHMSRSAATILEVICLFSIAWTISYMPEKYMLVLSPLYAVVILVFSSEEGYVSKVLRNRFLLLLGTLSYSIYMTHALITNVLKVVLINILKVSDLVFDLSVPLFTLIVLVCSYLTYHYVELKSGNYSKKLLSRRVIPERYDAQRD